LEAGGLNKAEAARSTCRLLLKDDVANVPSPEILPVGDDPALRASLAISLDLEGFLTEMFDCGEDLARAESRKVVA
jgi:hypothetical protein